MTEPNPSNHWDSLITDLGATPPDAEETLRQPVPQQPQPTRAVKPAPARRPRAAANWDQIAGELGVAPAPLPVEPPRKVVESPRKVVEPARKVVESPRKVVESPAAAVEAPRQVTVTPERGEESPNFFDEKFDFEEPFDLLESPVEGVAPPKAEEPSEKRPRKRRRRRPGRGSGERDSRGQAAPRTDDDRSTEPKATVDEISSRIDVGEEINAAEGEPAASDRSRSKRRRPRRGRKRRPGDEPKTEEPRGRRDDGEQAESREDAAFHDDFDVEDDAEGEGEERSVRAGFRGIPTWGETVGLLIEKNLENRAKRPAGGQQRGGRKRRS